ncbi:hypothetical protein ACTXT7_010109 [Hymenolepis weldensis]
MLTCRILSDCHIAYIDGTIKCVVDELLHLLNQCSSCLAFPEIKIFVDILKVKGDEACLNSGWGVQNASS